MMAAVLDLVRATVPACDSPPAGMPVPAGVDLTRDYFPAPRATRPPADAPTLAAVVAAIAADRLVA